MEYMPFLTVLAHGTEEVAQIVQPTLDEVIRSNSVKFSLLAGGVIIVLTIFSVLLKEKSEWMKYLLFGSFVAVALLNTIYLSGSTIYLNQKSETGGPVHWHADFEIWRCGQELELADPKGFSNKVGTEVIHEHDDKRIHIEGPILDLHDASLGHFFEEVGGSMSSNHLTIPTEEGMVTLRDGDKCPDREDASFQVFVYKTEGATFSQEKLKNPSSYILSPHPQVPPGDCIIIELDRQKDKTDKLCNFYKIAAQKGELTKVQNGN